jgi:hypothetical protein
MSEGEVNIPKRRGRPPGKPNVAPSVAKPKVARANNSRLPSDFVYEIDEDEDRLKVPKELIPDGMSYQWITDSIFGQGQPQRRARFERKGWMPVPAERHDGMWMPKGYQGEINVDGLVLMERPAEYTKMAHDHDKRKAREQVWIKEQQLRGGDVNVTLDGKHKTAVASNKIRKSYEPLLQVPDE